MITTFRNIIALAVLINVVLQMPDISAGQSSLRRGSVNPFKVYFLKFPSETYGKSRALVLVQVSYDKMRFLKKIDSFFKT